MKKIKTLLIFSLVIALSFSLFGCKLLPWGDSAAEETAVIAELPQWLTLAHRAEAAEEPEVEEEEEATEEEATEEEAAEAPAQTANTQPATTQPAPQPAPQPSGTPLYLQPGTMEYLAKLQLDQAARDIKSLDAQIASETNKDEARNMRAHRNGVVQSMYTIGAEIGLNIEKEYGLKPATAGTNASGDATWFHNWNESPSGFGN